MRTLSGFFGSISGAMFGFALINKTGSSKHATRKMPIFGFGAAVALLSITAGTPVAVAQTAAHSTTAVISKPKDPRPDYSLIFSYHSPRAESKNVQERMLRLFVAKHCAKWNERYIFVPSDSDGPFYVRDEARREWLRCD